MGFSTRTPRFTTTTVTVPAVRPAARLDGFRTQTENALRDMAYVLHLTAKVKQSILADKAAETLVN